MTLREFISKNLAGWAEARPYMLDFMEGSQRPIHFQQLFGDKANKKLLDSQLESWRRLEEGGDGPNDPPYYIVGFKGGRSAALVPSR
jgi:hypothetical protein